MSLGNLLYLYPRSVFLFVNEGFSWSLRSNSSKLSDSITVVSLSDFYFPLNNFPHNEHVLLTYLYNEHVLPIYSETKRLNFLWSNSFNHRKAFLYQFMPLQPLNRTKCKLSSRTMIHKILIKLIKVFFFKNWVAIMCLK